MNMTAGDMAGDASGWHDEGATDAGVDAPPAIGSDERRMHVRAYNYWASLLRGRAYPSIEDLEPEDLEDFGPHSVLLDFTAGAGNPGVAFIGGKLRRECGLEIGIESIADVPPRSLLSRLTDHYLQIIANRAPIGFEAEFDGLRGHNTLYRGILMPFSSDDETIDFVYGVINWKELVDAATQAQLDRDIAEASVAADALPNPAMPVFADGPSALGTTDPHDSAEPAMAGPAGLGEVALPDGPSPDAELTEWLEAARASAAAARVVEGRSRAALYEALGRAYDFALMAEAHPADFADLIENVGLTVQARAPMTPIVKLVFGADYDKTRLTEFAAALTRGHRERVPMGGLRAYVERFAGGLKGVVQAERARRVPGEGVSARRADPIANLRERTPIAHAPLEPAEGEEFVVLVARRSASGGVDIVGRISQPGLIERALRQAARDAA